MALEGMDIETLKHHYESDTEWNLRKKFLLMAQENYDFDRLLCLASCFINIECYGATYPGPVMIEIHALMKEMMDDIQHFRKKRCVPAN